MLKRIHKSFIFISIFYFIFLNVILFLHHHEEYCGKQKCSADNCIICVFGKYIFNLTFDIGVKVFYINIFFVVFFESILKPEFCKSYQFFPRAPPL